MKLRYVIALLLVLILAFLVVRQIRQNRSGETDTYLTIPSAPKVSFDSLPTFQYSETKDVSYGQLASQTLDVCLPKGGSGKAPAVIIIHGGGWSTGDKENLAVECRQFAVHGIAAFNINYRLFVPSTATNPVQNTWPTQLVDAQLALRSIRANAEIYNINPTKICAWGGSAGAQLSMFLGILSDNQPGDMKNLYTSQSPKVSCVIDVAGPADVAQIPSAAREQGGINEWVNNKGEQGLREVSPVFFINADTAPMSIYQGLFDTMIPLQVGLDLKKKLEDSGVPVRYLTYQGGHGTDGVPQTAEQQIILLKSQIEEVASYIGSLSP